MASDSERDSGNRPNLPAAVDDCHVAARDQNWNVALFVAIWAVIYLSSPVNYVGLLQSTLLDKLSFSNTLCNLPASIYIWSMPLSIIVIWYYPQVRRLRMLTAAALLTMGIMALGVAASLFLLDPNGILVVLLLHALVLGCATIVMASSLWEIVGRGISQEGRGRALALAYGFGPMLAVVASVGSQLILAGKMKGVPLEVQGIAYPWNFATIFAVAGVVLAIGAMLASRFVVPLPDLEPHRPPLWEGVVGGLVDFLTNRLTLIASIAYIGAYAGLMILNNISLYAKEAIGQPVDQYAGIQLAIRFTAKVVAGFALGWLLVKTNPKTLLVVTASLTLAGVGWALGVQGEWYLLAFALLGAGELFGVYYPNYVLDCSPKSKMRRNIALFNLVTIPAGFAPLVYGRISDTYGQTDKTFGFQMSFMASMLVLAATIVLVFVALPRRPTSEPDSVAG